MGGEVVSDAPKCIQVLNVDEYTTRSIYSDGEIVDDTMTPNYRKIVTYRGDDVTVSYRDYSTDIMVTTVNGEVIAETNIKELRKDMVHWTIPEEDEKLLREYLNTNQKNSKNKYQSESIISLEGLTNEYIIKYDEIGNYTVEPAFINATTYGAAKPIRPKGARSDVYPEYYDKSVRTLSQYSSICNRTLTAKVKDSMYGFIMSDNDIRNFAKDTILDTIADALNASQNIVKNTLWSYLELSGTVYKLTTPVVYYFMEKYTYTYKRQVFMYDYITNNRDVSVITEYSYGEVGMTWDWDSNKSEYTNLLWKSITASETQCKTTTFSAQEAIDIWEFNISEYGYWKWGDL